MNIMKKSESKKTTAPAVPLNHVRMNINIPKSFYKRVKLRALQEDKTIKDIVVKALEEYLK